MVKSVYGAFPISDSGTFNTKEVRKELAELLISAGVTHLDTARLYPGSEVAIGELEKRDSFTVDTKLVSGFNPGKTTREDVINDTKDSLERVGIKQFDILYLHAPDTTIPFSETLSGIAEVHKLRLFRRFGISNFSPAQVQEVYDIAKQNGYPLPEVYQGNYNPIARHAEAELFPLLRKLGISFYAYSPIAGGFLTKTTADLDAGAGRFNAVALGGLYQALYDKPSLRAALDTWNILAEKEGVSKAELAYRWVKHHSALQGEDDAIIFGSSSLKQTKQTADVLAKGPLSDEAVKGIEEIWESVKADAPVDNFQARRAKGDA